MAMGRAHSTGVACGQAVRARALPKTGAKDSSVPMRNVVVLLVLLLVAPSWARRPRPAPCPVGRFLTADGAHVVANVTEPASETIVVEPTSVTIDPACERVTFKPRVKRR